MTAIKRKPGDAENGQGKALSSPVSDWGVRLLWGVFFVTLGILVLLVNSGVLTLEMTQLWRLWPLLIIMAGVSLLSLSDAVGKLVYIGSSVLLVGAMVWFALDGAQQSFGRGETEQFLIAQDDQQPTALDLTVEAGAGRVEIGSGGGLGVASGGLTSNVSTLKQTSTMKGSTQVVTLGMDVNWQWWRGQASNTLSLRLGETLPTTLSIDAGAADVTADISNVQLESLSIDGGVSSVDVTLGSRVAQSEVTIETGVSTVHVRVPEALGVRIIFNGGLSSSEMPEGYREVEKHRYESANYERATNKTVITVDMGLSSFALTTYKE